MQKTLQVIPGGKRSRSGPEEIFDEKYGGSRNEGLPVRAALKMYWLLICTALAEAAKRTTCPEQK